MNGKMKRYISRLNFSISIPEKWEVYLDRYEKSTKQNKRVCEGEFKKPSVDEIKKEYEKALKSYKAEALSFDNFSELYARDKKKTYIAFFETCIGMPPDEDIEQYASRNLTAKEAYKQLVDDPETFMVDFDEFKRVCESEYKDKERRLEREKLRDEMIEDIGWFGASPSKNEDFVSIEVSKVKLKRPMPPLELYRLLKPDSSDILWGNRPSKPLIVDGLEAIRYYFAYENDKDWVKFLNIYMTDGLTGYIITCSSFWKSFPKYKNLFYSIVQSFKRIQ